MSNPTRSQLIALAVSVGANVWLLQICSTYFRILKSGGLMGSFVDSRGGLSEINGLIPLLLMVSVVGGTVASRNTVLKRFSIYSMICSLLLELLLVVLVNYI